LKPLLVVTAVAALIGPTAFIWLVGGKTVAPKTVSTVPG
jgi:hypothetical protein